MSCCNEPGATFRNLMLSSAAGANNTLESSDVMLILTACTSLRQPRRSLS